MQWFCCTKQAQVTAPTIVLATGICTRTPKSSSQYRKMAVNDAGSVCWYIAQERCSSRKWACPKEANVMVPQQQEEKQRTRIEGV